MDYNSEILEKHATKLDSKADSTEAIYVVIGIILGGIFGYFVSLTKILGELGTFGGFLIFAMIAGFYLLAGIRKTKELRLQANMAMALVVIEKNTRKDTPEPTIN